MLAKHIASVIKGKMKDEVTPSQDQLIAKLGEFTTSEHEDAILLVTGYAGTGKTTILSAYVEMLNDIKVRSVLLAPTGRAAKVLSHYTGRSAYTIHKKIYRQKSLRDGMAGFDLDRNLHARTIFIVDEASMISNQKQSNSIFGSGCLLDDLLEYVYNGRGCKLILVGDTAQLPPVGLPESPALEAASFRLHSDMVFTAHLTDVVRQRTESGILFNATHVRQEIDNQQVALPLFTTGSYPDIIALSGEELIETLSDCYSKYGKEETIVVSRSNKRTNKYNEGIRQTVLYHEAELVPGELLMVVKNNYYWLKEDEKLDFIANGDIIEILRVGKHYELYGYRFVDCTIRLLDYNVELDVKLMLDVLSIEGPALSSEKSKEFFFAVLEDYTHIKIRKKQYEEVRNNEFFNAIQVKYAYAITGHKSQGGQWKAVFVDQGYVDTAQLDMEYLRWLYTALTRATEKLYLVNFKKEFYY